MARYNYLQACGDAHMPSIFFEIMIQAFEQNVEAYSFQSYQAYALNFEKNYKYKTQPRGQTLESKKEDEYWSLVTKP